MVIYHYLLKKIQINVKFYADFELKWQVRYENALANDKDDSADSSDADSDDTDTSSDEEFSNEDQDGGDDVRVCDMARNARVLEATMKYKKR